ncbi:MAG TPA: heat-inducible transcriptional repressor HrcA [Bacilli bacterium]|nr:heat-inducible transcriptional repressor HrcA [Bacilli bacterium]
MLTERQKAILQILVDDYIRSAEPVGSRTISKRPEVSFSSATIRNEMSDLEELGYLEQPHTSAGRVPSQKGYRFYVDNLLHPGELAGMDLDSLRTYFVNQMDLKEQVVQQASQILSSLTNYTSIVMGPDVLTSKLRHIQLLPLQEGMAVAIIVTDTGQVHNRTVTIPEGIHAESLQSYVEYLNSKLHGMPLYRMKQFLYTEVANEMRRSSEQFEHVMSLFDQMVVLQEAKKPSVYLGGTARILNQPEFRDIDKLRPLLDMFEQQQDLIRLFGDGHSEGIRVRIGQENELEPMHQCSLITASYLIDGEMLGTIGVLGPTRMEYGRVIAVMNQMSHLLTGVLRGLHK